MIAYLFNKYMYTSRDIRKEKDKKKMEDYGVF